MHFRLVQVRTFQLGHAELESIPNGGPAGLDFVEDLALLKEELHGAVVIAHQPGDDAHVVESLPDPGNSWSDPTDLPNLCARDRAGTPIQGRAITEGDSFGSASPTSREIPTSPRSS
jgi:hypothetical protein